MLFLKQAESKKRYNEIAASIGAKTIQKRLKDEKHNRPDKVVKELYSEYIEAKEVNQYVDALIKFKEELDDLYRMKEENDMDEQLFQELENEVKSQLSEYFLECPKAIQHTDMQYIEISAESHNAYKLEQLYRKEFAVSSSK